MNKLRLCVLGIVSVVAPAALAAPPAGPAQGPAPVGPVQGTPVVSAGSDSRIVSIARVAARGDDPTLQSVSYSLKIKNPSRSPLNTKVDAIRFLNPAHENGWVPFMNAKEISIPPVTEENVPIIDGGGIPRGCGITRYKFTLADSNRSRYAKATPTCKFTFPPFALPTIPPMTGDVKLSVSNVGFDATPHCGSPYTVHATFKNEGTKPIVTVPLTLAIKNQPATAYGYANLSNMAPGATQTVTLTPAGSFDGSTNDLFLVWHVGIAFGAPITIEFAKLTPARSCTLDIALE